MVKAARMLTLGLALVLLGASLTVSGGSAAPQPLPTWTPIPDTGYRLYRLWCVSCHGDELRGLTPEWIAQWPATHQNCWVAKCHGSNPPPDGFSIPRTAPALAGAGALARFRTAADLHAYTKATMPFQDPGVLNDDQYWMIVGYVLDRHGISLPDPLTSDNAQEVELQPDAEPEPGAQTPAPVESQPTGPEAPPQPVAPYLVVVGAGGSALLAYVLWRRRSRSV